MKKLGLLGVTLKRSAAVRSGSALVSLVTNKNGVPVP